MTYQAPVDDIMLALKGAGDVESMIEDGVCGDLDQETLAAILEEAGRFAAEVLAPLNKTGDQGGVKLSGGVVTTPEGWKTAYQQFTEAGWSALPCGADHGGQDLPTVVAMSVSEFWNAANLAFGVCPLLTNGAIDSLEVGGSKALKDLFLDKMVSGQWSGTMNLTEPQAGSDLNAIKSKAVPQDDGTYRIFGTKIFISYGEHDLAENIIHLVLARLPDAPEGTRGISLFAVPKVLLNDDGSLGDRNDVVCTGVEHKLGIHGSPTCVMTYGEDQGAVGYLVGEENRGLSIMFVMMNAARLAVGVQGVAQAERATQKAKAYAHDRLQGSDPAAKSSAMVAIVEHPDVKRMLLTMAALTQAARCICLATAAATDRMNRAAPEDDRQAAGQRVALLTPIAKAFSTDVGCRVASLGVQIHGGMGYVEETGAAQYYRDARILPIYEGTNGIQAMDLVLRKLPLVGGAVVAAYFAEIQAELLRLGGQSKGVTREAIGQLQAALQTVMDVTAALGDVGKDDQQMLLAVATPYLELFGLLIGGYYLARCASVAEAGSGEQQRAEALLYFYADNLLPEIDGLAGIVRRGGTSVLSENAVHVVGGRT
jgi:3-(methylsulfanyl)propanoyl-CoA dehydrogenase